MLSPSIIKPSIMKSDISSDVESHENLVEEKIVPVDTTSKVINNTDLDHLKNKVAEPNNGYENIHL